MIWQVPIAMSEYQKVTSTTQESQDRISSHIVNNVTNSPLGNNIASQMSCLEDTHPTNHEVPLLALVAKLAPSEDCSPMQMSPIMSGELVKKMLIIVLNMNEVIVLVPGMYHLTQTY